MDADELYVTVKFNAREDRDLVKYLETLGSGSLSVGVWRACGKFYASKGE